MTVPYEKKNNKNMEEENVNDCTDEEPESKIKMEPKSESEGKIDDADESSSCSSVCPITSSEEEGEDIETGSETDSEEEFSETEEDRNFISQDSFSSSSELSIPSSDASSVSAPKSEQSDTEGNYNF